VNLRSWLRRSPHPIAIAVDGRRVPVPVGARRWAELEATIEAMGGSRLEALGQDGEVLRATELDAGELVDVDERSDASSRGASDLATFAALLSKAYEQGATATKSSYELAFSENTKLVGLLAQRLTALEVAWQKAMTQQASMQAAMAEQHDDGVVTMLAPLIANAAKGGK
jgi:hypothetical protein